MSVAEFNRTMGGLLNVEGGRKQCDDGVVTKPSRLQEATHGDCTRCGHVVP